MRIYIYITYRENDFSLISIFYIKSYLILLIDQFKCNSEIDLFVQTSTDAIVASYAYLINLTYSLQNTTCDNNVFKTSSTVERGQNYLTCIYAICTLAN